MLTDEHKTAIIENAVYKYGRGNGRSASEASKQLLLVLKSDLDISEKWKAVESYLKKPFQ